MKMRSIIANATILVVAIAGAYVLVRVSHGRRTETFALLSMAAVGASELVLALVGAVQNEPRLTTVGHGLTGLGGMAVGYSLLGAQPSLLFALGCLLFAAGVFIAQRSPPRASST